jgi:hypothetical protein
MESTECDYCGDKLKDGKCSGHTEEQVMEHVFRHLKTSEKLVVKTTPDYKWQRLSEQKGDEWVEWAYIGTSEIVSGHMKVSDNLGEVPILQTCIDAEVDAS